MYKNKIIGDFKHHPVERIYNKDGKYICSAKGISLIDRGIYYSVETINTNTPKKEMKDLLIKEFDKYNKPSLYSYC